jgi:hypothetical protein
LVLNREELTDTQAAWILHIPTSIVFKIRNVSYQKTDMAVKRKVRIAAMEIL